MFLKFPLYELGKLGYTDFVARCQNDGGLHNMGYLRGTGEVPVSDPVSERRRRWL